MNYGIEQLRNRHNSCVTLVDIKNDLASKRMSSETFERLRFKGLIEPACSHPEDGLCCAPTVPDDIVEAHVEKNRSGLGRPRKDG